MRGSLPGEGRRGRPANVRVPRHPAPTDVPAFRDFFTGRCTRASAATDAPAYPSRAVPVPSGVPAVSDRRPASPRPIGRGCRPVYQAADAMP